MTGVPQSAATATASLRLERRYRAGRETVFAALTRPDEVRQWFAPPGYGCVSAEIDLRPGGRYRFGMQKLPDGQPFYVSGTFQEIVPPGRLVYTWTWEDRHPEAANTRVTVELTEQDGGKGTLLVLTHELFATEQIRSGHIDGWTGALNQLTKLLEKE